MRRRIVRGVDEWRLRQLAQGRALLAFDFDGTLSPLVNDPSQASIGSSLRALLGELSVQYPIAVITGRSVKDAAPLLGFRPRLLYGNHGAEHPGVELDRRTVSEVDEWYRILTSHANRLSTMGVWIEHKGGSLALHYRQANDVDSAKWWLDTNLIDLHGALIEHGHCVVNVTSRFAPNKGGALRDAMDRCEADCALYIGDDSNDESAFRAVAPPGISIVIGESSEHTSAEFCLHEQNRVEPLLRRLYDVRRKMRFAH